MPARQICPAGEAPEQAPSTIPNTMKKILLLAICTASIPAHALPTYEPFTEFAPAIAASGSNSINLATGGYNAPSGEPWGALYFSGTAGTGFRGVDIYVTNYSAGSVFTHTALSSILPAGFPGFPAAGSSINIMAVNPAQPLAPGATLYGSNPNIVGNSAVLHFAQDITRPTNGTKTLFVSYLFSVAQKGQTGAGNVGRYLGFLAASNLNEGWTGSGPVPGAAYTNWASLFNTFGTSASSPKYVGHGAFNGSPEYIEAPDSSAGKNPASPPSTFAVNYNQPYLIVGEFVLTTGGAIADTNIVWVNPSLSSFGGATPPAPGISNPMSIAMGDLGGMVLIDRVGSGALGGVGTNYLCNLLLGSTWSYVTGGPEFTNQPLSSTRVNLGQNASLNGAAAAAGQTVTYQWVKILAGSTNTVSNGAGGAGGTATVSGATSATLTLTGVSSGDTGNYQLVARASGTGYTLSSTTATLALTDPQISANPANATSNYGQSASFTATVSTANAPLSYGWYHGATPLANGLQPDGSYVTGASGVTGAGTSFSLTLTLTNVSYQEIGVYTLFVTNQLGLYNSAAPATLAVNDPAITAQPANPAVVVGGTANFTVVATGSPTLTYQWYEGATVLVNGGTPVGGTATVSGADTATLTLTGVTDADNGSYHCQVTSSASSQSVNSAAATLTVQYALTIVSPPMSLAERAGDHVAFAVGVTGGGPQFQWSYNGIPISGATASALVLTNIQSANAGSYSVVVGNLATPNQSFTGTLTVLNSAVLPLSQTNLVVARVGDGDQTLSGATGNTLYLDQYTINGTYVNSTQVPDEGIGQPYGTGSSSSAAMPFGSPALLVAGAGADAGYEAMLSLSGGDQGYLGFAGYCEAYPFSGSDVTAGATAGVYWRGLATINAFGIYSLAYTNSGLYSAGNHFIRSMVTLDGTNFWTTGSAGAGGVKYVNSTVASYATGNGVPGSTGTSTSPSGVRTIQIVSGALPGVSSLNNLVESEAGFGPNNGLYVASGTPEPLPNAIFAFAPLLYTGGGQPGDFAFSPDNQTIYVADSGMFTSTSDSAGGGIQRWDSNGSGYSYSYTIQPLSGLTNGVQGLTADFSAAATWGPGITGAKIYATTTGAAGNSLVEIVDNGSGSTPTVLATAGLKQALRGVRFGPAAVAPAITSAPQDQTIPVGNSVTFSVSAAGSAPLFYQWYYGGVPLAGATQSSFTATNISYASAGSYSVVVSNLTTQIASITNILTVTAGAPAISPSPLPNYVQTAGGHLAWAPVVTGTQPITNYWYVGSTLIQSNVTPGASASLVLANIQSGNSGTYTLVVSNLYGHTSGSGSLTVQAALQTLSSNNLVVARVGDGVQTLSGATGNTLYLDQYTPGGGYVNTIQVPDEGTGQPYGTGSSSTAGMPFGSPALLFAGAGNDAGYEAALTRAPNGQTLNFAGYCQAYPFSGPDLSVGATASPNWRGIAEVNAYGYYAVVWTNTGLYSGGNHQVHAAVDMDGNGTNFYTAGQAGAGAGIKYCNINFQPANGGGIVSIAGTFSGTRVCEIINGNLVFSDAGASPIGIYACSGLPAGNAGSSLMIAETNSPVDFAASPDLNTVYIADNGAFGGTSSPAGGIQRWDGSGGVYTYSYTLATGNASTAGARALTVDFSAANTWGAGVTGAKLYATTAEPSGNRLVKIVDTGAASSATLLAAAGPNEMLAGVRFGPMIVPPGFSGQLQNQSAIAGSGVMFSAGALGSGPMIYQWYFQAGGVGAFLAINNATNATYAISAAGSGHVGNYYVVIRNPGLLTATSPTVSFTLLLPPQFTSETYLGPGVGFQLNFTGPAGSGYTIWASSDPALSPIQSTWTLLTTGIFSGGTDTYTDPSGGTNPQQFYIISVP